MIVLFSLASTRLDEFVLHNHAFVDPIKVFVIDGSFASYILLERLLTRYFLRRKYRMLQNVNWWNNVRILHGAVWVIIFLTHKPTYVEWRWKAILSIARNSPGLDNGLNVFWSWRSWLKTWLFCIPILVFVSSRLVVDFLSIWLVKEVFLRR